MAHSLVQLAEMRPKSRWDIIVSGGGLRNQQPCIYDLLTETVILSSVGIRKESFYLCRVFVAVVGSVGLYSYTHELSRLMTKPTK